MWCRIRNGIKEMQRGWLDTGRQNTKENIIHLQHEWKKGENIQVR